MTINSATSHALPIILFNHNSRYTIITHNSAALNETHTALFARRVNILLNRERIKRAGTGINTIKVDAHTRAE